MTTTTERETLWARATMPYALSGLAFHLIDFDLPVPHEISIRDGRITLWLMTADVTAWAAYADLGPETVKTRSDRDGGIAHTFEVHTVDAVLHCSGVKVTYRWTAPSDAVVCEGLDQTCTRLVGDPESDEPGCAHGHNLCAEHRTECDQCRDELGDDRPVMDVGRGWDR